MVISEWLLRSNAIMSLGAMVICDWLLWTVVMSDQSLGTMMMNSHVLNSKDNVIRHCELWSLVIGHWEQWWTRIEQWRPGIVNMEQRHKISNIALKNRNAPARSKSTPVECKSVLNSTLWGARLNRTLCRIWFTPQTQNTLQLEVPKFLRDLLFVAWPWFISPSLANRNLV